MVKATRKPPARIRYEQSHPTLSCRLDKDTYALLKQRLEDLGGVSFAIFIKDALGIQQAKMPDIEEIKEKAYDEGYEQGKKDYRIWSFCAVCREPIFIQPNTEMHKALMKHMDGWRHGDCAK
jgi:flagellar biosynthesis/type III secretory pathway protein FliH